MAIDRIVIETKGDSFDLSLKIVDDSGYFVPQEIYNKAAAISELLVQEGLTRIFKQPLSQGSIRKMWGCGLRKSPPSPLHAVLTIPKG